MYFSILFILYEHNIVGGSIWRTELIMFDKRQVSNWFTALLNVESHSNMHRMQTIYFCKQRARNLGQTIGTIGKSKSFITFPLFDLPECLYTLITFSYPNTLIIIMFKKFIAPLRNLLPFMLLHKLVYLRRAYIILCLFSIRANPYLKGVGYVWYIYSNLELNEIYQRAQLCLAYDVWMC